MARKKTAARKLRAAACILEINNQSLRFQSRD
jgi:hypothetical protein